MREAASTSFYELSVQRVARLATGPRIRAYTGMMAVLALGGGLLQLALGEGLLDSFGSVIGGDFIAFYTGARFFLEDRMAELYSLAAQLEFQRQVVSPGVPRGVHPFINPPHALLLYLGYGIWSYPVGLALWWLTGLGALVLSIALLRSEFGELRRHSIPALVGAAFLFFPTVAWVLYGQATALVLLIHTATFVLLRRRKDLAAGACLGCLAFKPQLAMLLALVLLFKGRWRALAGGALTAGTWVAAGYLLSPSAMARYGEVAPHLPDFLRSAEYPSWGIQSLFGFSLLLLDWLGARAADFVSWILCASVLFALARHWRATPWRVGTREWDVAMATSLALGLVVSPHLFLYDLMLLLLPFAIVWSRHASRSRSAPLDGGPLLAWTVALWGISFLGGYLAKGQLALCGALGLPPVAVQLAPLVVVVWAFTCLRAPASRESATL